MSVDALKNVLLAIAGEGLAHANQTIERRDKRIAELEAEVARLSAANSNSAEFDGIRSSAPAAGTVEKDAERLDFMISEECQIEHMTRPGAAPLCRVHWPWEGQAMRAWSESGREAIDAAIEARKDEKDSP
jgi:hypothetical protein